MRVLLLLLLIVTASIFLAVTTAMSSSILPQLASAATTTKNANFLTYQNSTYGVKIQYPSNWGVQTGVNTLDENGNLVQPIDIADIAPPIESDPNAVSYLQIGVEQQLTPTDTKNIDLYLRSIINGYRFNSTDFHLTSATTHATLAERQAYSLVFTDTYQGFPTKTMIRGIVDGDKNYYLLFTAESAKFDSFVPTVQKMINSFELSTPIAIQQEPGKLDNTLLYLSTAGIESHQEVK
jgi:eukaryotic-like serine/threonine-protein kinase